MRKTFIYKAKINRQTETNCNNWLNICRTLYNLALEQKKGIFKQSRKNISVYTQMEQLPELKTAFPEFKTVGSQCLQDVLQRLDKAFQAFFRRLKEQSKNAGYPRFKGKNRYDSFTLKQAGWKLDGRNLHIKNIGRFKLFLSRPIEGNIKTITIRKGVTGKWLVSFSCDNVPEKTFSETAKEVGIDVGIKSFCVDSEGEIIKNPKYLRQSENLLRKRQRSLSRKKKGSARRNNARNLVAKAHEKINDQRRDFLHKTANRYINSFQTIYVEDLNISDMLQNKHLSKSIADASWRTFFNLLSCKAAEAGRKVVKVKPHNTSQICSGCGEKVPESLSVRIHNCPFCKLKIDRDLNASINILAAGQAVQTLTCPVRESVV